MEPRAQQGRVAAVRRDLWIAEGARLASGALVTSASGARGLVVALASRSCSILALAGDAVVGEPLTPDGPLALPAGRACLGRALDVLGRPLDGGPQLDAPARRVFPPGPGPRLVMGARWITGLLSVDLVRRLPSGAPLLVTGGARADRHRALRAMHVEHRSAAASSCG
ncbi:MAG: hypothetical protein H6713_00955 [Myxococcales bacterium]|nr:hypothetical protein [Myxococcales bacterium]